MRESLTPSYTEIMRAKNQISMVLAVFIFLFVPIYHVLCIGAGPTQTMHSVGANHSVVGAPEVISTLGNAMQTGASHAFMHCFSMFAGGGTDVGEISFSLLMYPAPAVLLLLLVILYFGKDSPAPILNRERIKGNFTPAFNFKDFYKISHLDLQIIRT